MTLSLLLTFVFLLILTSTHSRTLPWESRSFTPHPNTSTALNTLNTTTLSSPFFPPSRTSHVFAAAGATGGNGNWNWIVFGGKGMNGVLLSDFWYIDVAELELGGDANWTSGEVSGVSGDLFGRYGSGFVPIVSESLDSDFLGLVVIYGGITENNWILDEMIVIGEASESAGGFVNARKVETSGSVPRNRTFPAMWSNQDGLGAYLACGADELTPVVSGAPCSTIYHVANASEGYWVVRVFTNAPSPRYEATTWSDYSNSRERLFMYGGRSSSQIFGDLYYADFQQVPRQWTRVYPSASIYSDYSGSSGSGIGKRFRPAVVSIETFVFVCFGHGYGSSGGSGSLRMLQDCFVYDMDRIVMDSAEGWTFVRIDSRDDQDTSFDAVFLPASQYHPGSRMGTVGATIPGATEGFFFGGERVDGLGADVWSIDFQMEYCDNIPQSAAAVCSSNGTCFGSDNCSCDYVAMYTGPFCESPYCVTTNSSVDCLNGYCLGPNTCLCDAFYIGDHCDIPMCYGTPANDSSVCSSRGDCESPDICRCSDSSMWTGLQCEIPVCFGSNGASACNGVNGNCTAPGDCLCIDDSLYTGSSCSDPVCGFPKTDDRACSGRGTCLVPGICSCDDTVLWTGDLCDVQVITDPLGPSIIPIVGAIMGSVVGVLMCLAVLVAIIFIVMILKSPSAPSKPNPYSKMRGGKDTTTEIDLPETEIKTEKAPREEKVEEEGSSSSSSGKEESADSEEEVEEESSSSTDDD